jgi:ribosomal protein S27AE
MQEAVENKKPSCPNCGGGYVLVRKDKSTLCRRCGHDSREEETK